MLTLPHYCRPRDAAYDTPFQRPAHYFDARFQMPLRGYCPLIMTTSRGKAR